MIWIDRLALVVGCTLWGIGAMLLNGQGDINRAFGPLLFDIIVLVGGVWLLLRGLLFVATGRILSKRRHHEHMRRADQAQFEHHASPFIVYTTPLPSRAERLGMACARAAYRTRYGWRY